ncbi:MAG: cytochrome c biogenesis protein CcdA [Pseudomonadales bacterium]
MTLDAFLENFASSLPDGSVWAVFLAIAAGVVASSVCPCTIPVGLGVAGVAGSSESKRRGAGVLIALAFFAGIVINLTILGSVAGRMGAILTESFGRYWALGMALVSFIAAVAAFRGPRPSTEKLASLRGPGMAGAFVYGFIFSLGTSAAPLLLLLTVAAAHARPEYGFILALAFSVGRGLPFLLAGLVAGALMRFARLSAWTGVVRVASGSALLFVGLYYAWAFAALL